MNYISQGDFGESYFLWEEFGENQRNSGIGEHCYKDMAKVGSSSNIFYTNGKYYLNTTPFIQCIKILRYLLFTFTLFLLLCNCQFFWWRDCQALMQIIDALRLRDEILSSRDITIPRYSYQMVNRFSICNVRKSWLAYPSLHVLYRLHFYPLIQTEQICLLFYNCLLANSCTIKQFVVTNCSKERPGSIVTEILKNRILIPIVSSKESHFNADCKYISFIKISYTHQKLRAWENLPHFRK